MMPAPITIAPMFWCMLMYVSRLKRASTNSEVVFADEPNKDQLLMTSEQCAA